MFLMLTSAMAMYNAREAKYTRQEQLITSLHVRIAVKGRGEVVLDSLALQSDLASVREELRSTKELLEVEKTSKAMMESQLVVRG